MAINIPIITEFVDKGLKSAEAGFAHFKGKVAEAEGGMGKLKAGFGAATDYMKANAATFAAAAGSAIAGFAIKAIGDFQDLSLSVDKFRDATGLTLDEASRWTEVAGDIDIDAGTIERAINKMNKEASKGEDYFADLGVEMKKHKDGTYDPQATFLEVIDTLKNIKDPADKAKIATQLFGKSWRELADLVNMGSDEIIARLEDVSDAKIINEEEVQKAKDLRDAQDALNDALGDFALIVGSELIPILTDLTEAITPVLEKSDKLIDILKLGFGTFRYGLWDSLTKINVKLADGAIKAKDAGDEIEDLGDESEDTADKVSELTDEWSTLLGKLDMRDAFRNVEQSFDDVAAAAGTALEEKTPEAIRAAQEAFDDLYGDVADYIELLGDVPAEKQTEILVALDSGNLAEAKRLLDELARDRVVNVRVSGGTTVRPGDTPSESRSRGVNVVGPDGRSYYIPPGLDFSGFGKGTATTKSANLLSSTAASSQPSVTVNVAGSVTSERDLVETIRKGLVNSQRNGSQLVYSNT